MADMAHSQLFSSSGRRSAETGFSDRRLPLDLAVGAVIVAFLYIASRFIDQYCTSEGCLWLRNLLDMNEEANLPTWYTVACWFIAGILAHLIAKTESDSRQQRLSWHLLTGLCFYASFDELAMFHDRFGALLGQTVNARATFAYDWLLFGLIAVAVVGVVFLPFLWRLPKGTRNRIVLAGALFVSGAVGVEFLGAASSIGWMGVVQGRVGWVLAIGLEETLEIFGVIMLIHALLHHMKLSGVARYRP